MSDDLAILNPEVDVVVLSAGLSETIRIKPFTFGQFAKVAKLLRVVAPAIQKNFESGSLDFLGLIADAGEPVYDVLAIAAQKPRAWFDKISGADGLAIAQAVIEQNKEEFEKKLAPSLENLAAVVGAKRAQAQTASAPEAEAPGEPSTQS